MIGKYPKCYNRYIIQNKLKNVINKHKSNKIKENSNTVRHLNNGTDHRHSKSCCDQSSPARRTKTKCTKTITVHECRGASNDRQLYYLFNGLPMLKNNKENIKAPHHLTFVQELHRLCGEVPVDPIHKWPIMRTVSPCHIILMPCVYFMKYPV